MQPGTNPDDIHTILNRFSSWSGKQSANGNGHKVADEGVREIPYEEALRQLRTRRPAPAPRAEAAAAPAVETAASIPAKIAPANTAPAEPCKVSARRVPNAAKPAVRARPRAASAEVVALKPAPRSQAATKPSAVRPAKPRKAPPQEFRQVLAKSVRQTKSPAAKPAKPERAQRVSVRLSQAEEQQLQQFAAKAGVTVSEYLRRRALEALPASGGKKANLFAEPPAATQPIAAAPVQSKSTLGDWITLLRNRFLASPPRFAERA
ncbi:MAG TPA: hypothetical protein VHX60_16230 [Acidobacteriaceae bacterium]|nr:hypothetical protein [Acidobacteriaceae bacterium]